MSLTGEVAGFITRAKGSEIPSSVIDIAKDHILDTAGVMLAGSGEACSDMVRQVYGLGAGDVPVFGLKATGSPALAALANGVAGHALDYDDTQLSTSKEAVYGLLTHPSVPVFSAAASVAASGRLGGRELVDAYVVGVEVACRVADAMNPRHYRDGFHTTGTVGTLGAAAAVARLLSLSEEQTARALGIAASMASGLRENFGTMTKPLHSGRAGHNGVLAAQLAQLGYSASGQILEAPRGFFAAAAGGFDPEKIHGKLGRPFFLSDPGVSIKPYPSGSLSHPAQDLILDMVRTHRLTPEVVQAVEVGTNANVPNALIHKRPKTGLQGKFSMEYCMATAVCRGRAGLAEFKDEAVLAPEIQAFLPRVTLVVDPRLEALGYQHVRSRVKVTLKDGTVHEGEAEWARGYPTRPLSAEALMEKFLECAETCLSPERARAAGKVLRRIDQEPAAEALAALQPA